jgi:hypothetical protein
LGWSPKETLVAVKFHPAFSHDAVHTKDRIMIESVCMRCGARKLVSIQDGSLEKWEDDHDCGKRQPREVQTR